MIASVTELILKRNAIIVKMNSMELFHVKTISSNVVKRKLWMLKREPAQVRRTRMLYS